MRGELARFRGDAPAAETAYGETVTLKPAEDRGWYGLGSMATEKENITAGRRNLLKALALDPEGAGYRGELATAETFANNFPAAQALYDQALKSNPADYVALTGLGLLQLKRGKTEAALESFLRASLMEPKYARVHVYAAVAYYQLGNASVALAELARASELDDKDPLPHQLATMIHTDHFEPGQAVREAREAMRKMPYLKSLNQIANNQQGTANLGTALAFFGMEDWAQNLAQESYYPYWAGSHLFLADRYPGIFNRRSELYQGYITDPTVFGASNRFQTLLQRPGNYASAFVNAGADNATRFAFGRAVVNGFDNRAVPVAYFAEYEDYRQRPRGYYDRAGAEVGQWITAVGAKPSDELGLFFFGKSERFSQDLRNFASIESSDSLEKTARMDIGGHYRFGPTNQLWFKYGQSDTREHFDDRTPPEDNLRLLGLLPRSVKEYALRQTLRLTDRAELVWGMERADSDSRFDVTFIDRPTGILFAQVVDQGVDRSRNAYLSLRLDATDRLLLQGDLYHQRYLKQQTQTLDSFLIGSGDYSTSEFNPRAGLVYKLGPNRLVRLAYQRWIKPPSIGTISPVATAGIPVNDEIPENGGRVARVKAQFEWEWNPRTYSVVFLSDETIRNIRSPGVFNLGVVPAQVPDIERLQNKGLASIYPVDALEDSPVFSSGEVRQAGVAVNRILGERWSGFARYRYTDSENTGLFPGLQLPWLPRHVAAFGSTWIGANRLLLSAQAAYRSERFRDEDHARVFNAGWSANLKAYWESADKRVSLSFGIDNLLHKNIDAVYRLGLGLRF